MSADNWTTCPRCFDAAKTAAEAEREQVMALYGILSVEEFDRERAALKTPTASEFQTFREDYEFWGSDDGVLRVSYSGRCTNCDLSVTLTDEKTFWPEGTER